MRVAKSILAMSVVIGLFLGCEPDEQRTPKSNRNAAQTRPAERKSLPAGFVAVEGSPIHPSGWPKEIRCTKDNSVMVFVPGGKFISGLSPKQLNDLAQLENKDYCPTKPGEPLIQFKGHISGLEKIKPGKMVTKEDLRDIEKRGIDQQIAVLLLAELEEEGKQIPQEDLNRWRAGEKSFRTLLEISAVRKALGVTAEQVKILTQTTTDVAKERLDQTKEYLKSVIRPQAKVKLGPFYIDKYEVTNRRYRLFMAEIKDKKRHPGIRYNTDDYNMLPQGQWRFYDLWQDNERNHDYQPVTCVGKKDVEAYALWAGKSIPTRLQWERAAIGKAGQLFPWGSDFKPDYCRCRIEPIKPAESPGRDKEDRAPALVELWQSGKKLRNARGWRSKARELGKAAKQVPAAAGEMRGIAKDLRQLVREFRDLNKPAIPSAVGKYPHDRSPFGCCDMAGNVSEWVKIPSKKIFGWPKYVPMGGNADSLSPDDLVPAQKRSYQEPGRLLGFRTVLLLEQAKDR